MKNICLLNERLKSKNGVVKFTYDKYWDAINAICEDIKEKIKTGEYKDIALVGMARGALPMLVSVSHEIGVRKVSMIQLQMSNSDNPHDYGKVKLINKFIDKDVKKCILLEDIIYKGQTTGEAIKILKAEGIKVESIYSLIVDEGYGKIDNKPIDVDINYAYSLKADEWVNFLWEKDLRKE